MHNPNHAALVAIDPGRNTGFAVFVRFHPVAPFTLQAAGVIQGGGRDVSALATDLRTKARTMILQRLWALGFHPGETPAVVCEYMVFRPEDRRSVVEDLFQVQAVAGVVCGAISDDIRYVRPDEWKGSVPKEIMERRIAAAVWSEELPTYSSLAPLADSLRHNAIDAVGIGFHATGRFRRGGA